MTFTERLYTQPVLTPVILAEAKQHLRITASETADDEYITSLIAVATLLVEQHTNRALLTQTWDHWVHPSHGYCSYRNHVIRIPRGPVASVDVVEEIDEDGIATTIDGGEYTVDLLSEQASIRFKSPLTKRVHIRYTAGYTAATGIPAPIRHAVLLTLGSLFENRQDEYAAAGGLSSLTLTLGVEALLRNYRLFPLGLV
jgi:uncharacterized phiE125 gp8 family phage protein